MAEVKENSAAWLKKWVKNFRMPTAKRVALIQEALDLVIDTDILKWADWTAAKNYELELKPIEIKKSEELLTWAQLKKWVTEWKNITDPEKRILEIRKYNTAKHKRINQDIEESYTKPSKKCTNQH